MISKIFVSAALAGVALSATAPVQEDCSKSEAPHSKQCLSEWFLDAGCTSLYAISAKAPYAKEPDVAKIKQQMADLYASATAADADPMAVRQCKPMTDTQKQGQQCFDALDADCPDCFIGPLNAIANETCLGECITGSADLQEQCPQIAQAVKCDNTLYETCGKCVSAGFLGTEIVDPDCFEQCYKENNATIREACPLPPALQKLWDCHGKLADVCSDCVGEDHEIDIKCLNECWKDNQAELEETCPQIVGNITEWLVNAEDKIKAFFANLLSNLGDELQNIADLLNPEAQGGGSGNPLQDILGGILAMFGDLLSQLGIGGQGEGQGSDILSSILGELSMTDIPTESFSVAVNGIFSELAGEFSSMMEPTPTDTSVDDEPTPTEKATEA